MGRPWKLTVRGVRGSVPTPAADHLAYGGNTACFTVDWDGGQAVLDAGTGLTGLTGAGPWHILLSHLHMDHIAGLFGFAPLQDSTVHLYGPAGSRSLLEGLVGPPFWPVGLGQAVLHETAPGRSFPLPGGVEVSVLAGCHPNGSLLYRLTDGETCLVYALDCELAGDMAARLTAFAQGADLLIWDTAFAPGDLRPGWGHSTWAEGIALGRAAEVGQVLMTHYGPDYDDRSLQAQERLAHEAGGLFAREGMTIEL